MITFDLGRNVSQFPSAAECFERDKEKTFSRLCVAVVIAAYRISFGIFLREIRWVSLSIRLYSSVILTAGCQPKTFLTFLTFLTFFLMVKPF